MLTHLEKHGSSVRILFFNYFMVINTWQPVLLKNKLERPTWGASPGRVDPGLPHKQTPNCESLGLCVWPLNLQCGDSPGNYPSPLPLHTLHCRLHNGDDCVLKQFSIVSVLVSFLTDDDTEYRGLTQDCTLDWCHLNYLLINARKTKAMALVYYPCPLNIRGTKIEWVDS